MKREEFITQLKLLSVINRLIFLSFLILFSNSCVRNNDDSFKNEDLLSIHFVKEFETEGEPIIGHIRDIHLDDYGNIYVLGWGRKSILIFSQDGALIKEFVNKGQGPGEYLNLREIFIKDNSLFLVDNEQLRVSEFKILNEEADLAHIQDTIYPNRAFTRIEHFWVLDDQTYAFVFFKEGFAQHNLWEDKFAGLQLFDKEEQAYNEILVVPGKEAFRYERGGSFGIRSLLPFGTYPVFAWDGERFLLGNNRELKIEAIDLHETTSSAIMVLDVEPEAVTKTEAEEIFNDEYYQNKQKEIREQLPAVWRLYDTFVLDDKGRFWFSMNKDGHREGSLWWVFDQEGNGLFKMEPEEPVLFKRIQNGQAYGIKTREMGNQTLVKYSFDKK